MSITLSSQTSFDHTVITQIRKELEEELLPSLPHLADSGLIVPANFVNGTNNTLRFLRMPYQAVPAGAGAAIIPGTAPWLNEAQVPTAAVLTFGYEEFSAGQQGQTLSWSDIAAQRTPINLSMEAGKQIARLAAENADAYVAYILSAGTNVLYAGTGNLARTDVGATDVLTGSLLRKATQTMKADLIPTFGDGSYHAIIHPNVVFDFENDADVGGWLRIAQYNAGTPILSNELGKYAGIRFMESARAAVFAAGGAGGANVYSTFISGPGSFAFGDWNGTEFFYTAPGGQTDPLHQVYILGYKANFGAMLVKAAGPRYLRIESGSALG